MNHFVIVFNIIFLGERIKAPCITYKIHVFLYFIISEHVYSTYVLINQTIFIVHCKYV